MAEEITHYFIKATQVVKLNFLNVSDIFVLRIKHASAQSKSAGTTLCNRDYAVDLIKQQVAITRTFDNAALRIAVLNRAAYLLWSFEQEKAREAFSEAFEVAAQTEK